MKQVSWLFSFYQRSRGGRKSACGQAKQDGTKRHTISLKMSKENLTRLGRINWNDVILECVWLNTYERIRKLKRRWEFYKFVAETCSCLLQIIIRHHVWHNFNDFWRFMKFNNLLVFFRALIHPLNPIPRSTWLFTKFS